MTRRRENILSTRREKLLDQLHTDSEVTEVRAKGVSLRNGAILWFGTAVIGVLVLLLVPTVGQDALSGAAVVQEQGRVTDGLVVLYEFKEGAGQVVSETSGVGQPLNLTISDATGVTWAPGGGVDITGDRVAIRTDGAATKIIDALRASNELTIEAVVTPRDTTHTGPARIVSLSRDTSVRNFTLGQTRSQYIMRLRTSRTDTQGTPETETDRDVLKAERQHVVVTYTAGSVRIYVDGEPKGLGARTGDFSTWDPTFRFLLGNEGTLDRQWHGKIELVAIYSRGLSAEEIKRNFDALAN